MKEFRITVIATIITVLLIASCALAMPVQAEELPEFYPKLTVVVNSTRIESRLWAVECKDKEGHVWAFYDENGTWAEGDIANLLMWRNSPNFTEHEIIDVTWEGYTEDISKWFDLEGWH